MLFDLGSAYFNLFFIFSLGLDMVCDIFDKHVNITSLVGYSMVVTQVYHSYYIIFIGFLTCIDLVILDMLYFDIIMGMTRLSLYYVVLN